MMYGLDLFSEMKMSADISLILRHCPGNLPSPDAVDYRSALVKEVIEVCLPLVALMARIESRTFIKSICLEYPIQLILGLKNPDLMEAVRAEIGCRLASLDTRAQSEPPECVAQIIQHDRVILLEGRASLDAANWDLLGLYGDWIKSGLVEPVVGPFTPVPLTAYLADPGVVKAQMYQSIGVFRETFDRDPAGFLLTHSGHTSSMTGLLAETGVSYAVVDQMAFDGALAPLRDGPYRPIHCPDGALGLFADQRNFYRWKSVDSFDSADEYRQRDVLGPISWSDAGQGKTALVYSPSRAAAVAGLHGKHVCESRIQESRTVLRRAQGRPILLGCVDVGRRAHDWYEVIDFVDGLLDRLSNERNLVWSTPGQYLRTHTTNQSCWLGPTLASRPLDELVLSRAPALHEAACRLHYVNRLASFLEEEHRETVEAATRHLLWAQRCAREIDGSAVDGSSLYSIHLDRFNGLLDALEQALPEGAEPPVVRPVPKPKAPRRKPVYNPLTIT